MRKFLFTLLFAAVSIGAIAQESKQLININQESFRPEQRDVLGGVNIDPIAKDRSQRECARIKLHVNRMTREEIDQLQVHIAGGMVALTKKETSYEGNGLILEMTAKPGTRFHIHHDKYGDSNQVTVNLEGNKVYLLDAQLDLLLSVAVASNIKGADVYIDDTYKGVTGENYMLTVKDITPGEHKITIKQGAAVAEQMVNVNSDNISFRVEVNTVTSRPQYVVFNVKPQNAMVFIDNKPITTNSSGIASTVLQNGTYAWRVMANGYHEQSGTFTVSGAKVVKSVELVADAAMVTISAGEGAEIWVNNELKGKSPWRGQLLSGTYIFEARREGHRTTILSQTITSERAEQSYTLEVPTPIIGTVNVTSEPAMADVFVDGKNIGQTPLFADLLVGNHNLEIRHQGYNSTTQTVMVTEGNIAAVNVALEKIVSSDEAIRLYNAGDYTNAFPKLLQAAEAGDANAAHYVGESLYTGRGTTQNIDEAVKWYRKAAEQGSAIAQNAYGWLCANGKGVTQDYCEAVKWYHQSAVRGNANGQFWLGWCYGNGNGVTQDYYEAVKWYRKAAEQNHIKALNWLGWCYENGKGVTQDYQEAIKWYLKSAEQGDTFAQNNLGICYELGNGVTQDYCEAAKWYRKAAEQGHTAAQNSLGVYYSDGKGVTQNHFEAAKWYRKAAEQGNANAQNNLGINYANGYGVIKDLSIAIEWYRKAAEQGHMGAKKALQEMGVSVE